MQPENQRGRPARQGVARARLLLKRDLYFLPGFPTAIDCTAWAAHDGAVSWSFLPSDLSDDAKGWREIYIDRELLRRAELTVTKLRHRFPRALPRIVGDADDWLRRFDLWIDALKRIVHRQDSEDDNRLDVNVWLADSMLPRRWREQFDTLRQSCATADSRFRPLLDAVLSLEYTSTHGPSEDGLRWLEANRVQLDAIAKAMGPPALRVQLVLYACRNLFEPDFQRATLDLLAHRNVWACSSNSPYARAEYFAEQIVSDHVDEPIRPSSGEPSDKSVGDLVRSILFEVRRLRATECRAASRLIGTLLPSENVIVQLGDLETHATEQASALKKALAQRVEMEWTTGLPRKKRLKQMAVVGYDEEKTQLLKDISLLSENVSALGSHKSQASAWNSLLELLPLEAPIRLRLFGHWFSRLQSRLDPIPQILAIAGLIRRHGLPDDLVRRSDFLCNLAEIIDSLTEDELTKDQLRRAILMLKHLLFSGQMPIASAPLTSIGTFATATDDAAFAWAVFDLLSREAENTAYGYREITIACALTKSPPEAMRLIKAFHGEWELVEVVEPLATTDLASSIRNIVTRAVLKRDTAKLQRLSIFTGLASEENTGSHAAFSPPSVGGTPAWANRYPDNLHRSLAELESVTPDAKLMAEDILATNFPAPWKTTQQIEAVRAKLADTAFGGDRNRLEARLRNLQTRLMSPPTVSDTRIGNLIEKIQHRIDDAVVEHFVQYCYPLAPETVRIATALKGIDHEVFQSPLARILKGVLELQPSFRTLGLRLLFKHFSEPTTQFNSAAPNVAFVRRMQQSGIVMEPWLSGDFRLASQSKDGLEYDLFFTHSVLDYLTMGLHFRTCLSPDSCNFFSTISNAVDVNKQVVYGKTSDGEIVGRCLFALNNSGQILTFQRYSHDGNSGFREAVDEFADRLCTAMNTTKTSAGSVASLVTKDWYNDGALGNDVDLYAYDGPIRIALRTASPDDVLNDLLHHFSSEDSLRDSLDALIGLDEVRARPEIATVFARSYGTFSAVHFTTRFRLAVVANESGDMTLAKSILNQLRPSSFAQRLRGLACNQCGFHDIGTYPEVVDLMIEFQPSIAMRVMRASRPKGVEQDTEEWLPVRRRCLAQIHRRLGREKLAETLEAAAGER